AAGSARWHRLPGRPDRRRARARTGCARQEHGPERARGARRVGARPRVPAELAARLARVPSAIFLPDVEPGLAVRALSRIANRVACSVETTRRFLPPAKVVPTGYPVRPPLRVWAERPDGRRAGRALLGVADDRPLVLVM